jgi:hypothetical protein
MSCNLRRTSRFENCSHWFQTLSSQAPKIVSPTDAEHIKDIHLPLPPGKTCCPTVGNSCCQFPQGLSQLQIAALTHYYPSLVTSKSTLSLMTKPNAGNWWARAFCQVDWDFVKPASHVASLTILLLEVSHCKSWYLMNKSCPYNTISESCPGILTHDRHFNQMGYSDCYSQIGQYLRIKTKLEITWL